MSCVRRVLSVLWPSFLVAGLIEALVFAFVDPRTLRWTDGAPLELAPAAVHTLAFFAFWALAAIAAAIAQLLALRPADVNAMSPPDIAPSRH